MGTIESISNSDIIFRPTNIPDYVDTLQIEKNFVIKYF